MELDMTKMLKTIIAATILVGGGTAAMASAFIGGTVIMAPASDPLNARAWPSTSSVVQRTYVNGDMLSLTGTCKNIVTNVTFSIGTSSYWKMKKPYVWCKIWHEVPNGSGIYKIGWVRGKYVHP